MLLIASDPLINSLREIYKNKVSKLPVELLKLLNIARSEEPRHASSRLSQRETDSSEDLRYCDEE